MALVGCFECGKQVSDKAALCPHCGAPKPPVKRSDYSCGSCGADQPDNPWRCSACGKFRRVNDAIIVSLAAGGFCWMVFMAFWRASHG